MITKLLNLGYSLVNSLDDADIIIINTCAVREESELKFFKRIQELKDRINNKKVVIAGCLVKIRPSKIKSIIPNAILIDANSVEKIDQVITDSLMNKHDIHFSDDRPMRELPKYNPEIHGHIYVVPIQVGCLCSCTFCVTKFARNVKGKVKSYPIEVILEHVRDAVKKGAREIYLTGQDVATYGFDKGYSLADLIEKILKEIDGKYLIRIGMSEPSEYFKFIDQLLDVMKNDWRVYRFFHIPVQSGSDKVLRLMRRKYTVDEYVELINKIRRVFPDANIVTDIIVGFPGENDDDFWKSIELVRKLKFDKVHVSRYSRRPFTEAEFMNNQVPDFEKKRRSRIMTRIANEVALERNKLYVGKILDGILSTYDARNVSVIARILNYKPVLVESKHLGLFARINIMDTTHTHLIGNILMLEEIDRASTFKSSSTILEEDTS